ncbi:hypothetical protein AVEN_232399-1 [Araneus ventricosus]|uniref:Uncharacterized protein n=1 Tax=Araneus ventricosus TaxID=182803 RepID=A0A4Y2CW59_ARAVE|nr:hypothetical protein AVEN_232399-1 [Araneus ventricosus]
MGFWWLGWDWRIFDLKLDSRSTLYSGLVHIESDVENQTSSSWCDEQVWVRDGDDVLLSSSNHYSELRGPFKIRVQFEALRAQLSV